jgi:hypothetical protein
MIAITGDSYMANTGLMVICDPECIKGTRISVGDHVVYEGKVYVLRGVMPPSMKLNKWTACLELRGKEIPVTE